MCAIAYSDRLTCWGNSTTGQTTIPKNIGTVKDVACGAEHTCVIDKKDNNITCWGSNFNRQISPPKNLTTATNIESSGFHSCAITSDSNVYCWEKIFMDKARCLIILEKSLI